MITDKTKTFIEDYRTWLNAWNKLWNKTYEQFDSPAVYDGDAIEHSLKYLQREAVRLVRFEAKMVKALLKKKDRRRK